MKKAVSNHKSSDKSNSKISPAQEKKIRDFMNNFGKNLNSGDEFDEKDLTTLI